MKRFLCWSCVPLHFYFIASCYELNFVIWDILGGGGWRVFTRNLFSSSEYYRFGLTKCMCWTAALRSTWMKCASCIPVPFNGLDQCDVTLRRQVITWLWIVKDLVAAYSVLPRQSDSLNIMLNYKYHLLRDPTFCEIKTRILRDSGRRG
jgi:hypothetical protein